MPCTVNEGEASHHLLMYLKVKHYVRLHDVPQKVKRYTLDPIWTSSPLSIRNSKPIKDSQLQLEARGQSMGLDTPIDLIQ